MRALLVLLMLAPVLGACAVKGYDLGWRLDGRLTVHLGRPLDPLAGCVVAPEAPDPPPECRTLESRLSQELAALPPLANAPEALGARCSGARCTYANVFERRDVGTALVIPVYKRIVLREARIGMVLEDGRWRVEFLSIRDNAPPGYGPVTFGGAPARS